MAIAEVFLGAFLAVLFERLASRELLSFVRSARIHTQVMTLLKVLSTIKELLNDAETKQITNETVNLWLEDLRDLAYDMDDLVDEIETEALAHKLKTETEPAATTGKVKVLNFLSTSLTDFRRSIELKFKFGSKIKQITLRLQEMAQLRDDLGLTATPEAGSSKSRERLETTSLVVESHVYGREKEKKEILELVLKDESNNDEARVIPIVGMGGVGKTTLAQLVYNDEKVKDFFDTKAWVCVSEEFDVFMITKIICQAVTKESCDFSDLNMLQVSLKKKLSRRKFLIVLDDVWNENYQDWDRLRAPFLVGLTGSKIIVTTRNEGVARIMGSVPSYPLNVLAEDDCLSLLAQHSLGKTNFVDHPNLGLIGKDIVRKCGRLPLAAKTLGGLLRNIHSPDEWKGILNSQIWELEEHKSRILPALRLSYHHLPSELKQMFAYCAIFPKDYEFEMDELVLLWMAEGFLQQSEEMEVLGGQCFMELLSRSFFQRSGGTESKFVMHDLLNDLAQYVAGETCFRLDDNMEGNEWCKISKKACHSSFNRHPYEVYKRFKPFHEFRGLRTFIPLPIYLSDGHPNMYLSNSVLVKLLPNLRYLRVLSLSGYLISKLPNSIGDLKHLRYLNLSQTLIESLPKSVSTLYNLQTLSLRNCLELRKLPTNIGNLVNLRHLDIRNTPNLKEMPPSIGNLVNLRHLGIRDTPNLKEMPSGISRLKCLQTLSRIIVGKNNGFGLENLSGLSLLRSKLSIEGLENVTKLQEAEKANLSCKQYLNELEFKWNRNIEDSQNEGLQVSVLGMLRPHRELKSLRIEFYRGSAFPSWIGDPSFSKTVCISLTGCTKCMDLPPLGQLPLLKELYIEDMHAVESVGVKFYCSGSTLEIPFPSLEILRFDKMPKWKEWSFSYGVDFRGLFPCLRELSICNCPKLVSLPHFSLPSLLDLIIKYCDGAMLKSFTGLSSLTKLEIRSMSGLTHLPKEFTNGLVSLKVLEIEGCATLVTLWQNGFAPEYLSSLQRLKVYKCPLLEQLLDKDQRLPCNLERLDLKLCQNLERLPDGLKSHTSLTEVDISDCQTLVCFPEDSLPPKLSHLCVTNSFSLEFIPNCISRLEVLRLRNCSSLRSLPTDTRISTLKHVLICCGNLEWLKEMVKQSISFGISNWPNLESFTVQVPKFTVQVPEFTEQVPEFTEQVPDFECELKYQIDHSLSGSGLLTPNLTSLDISKFENLFSFPSESQSLAFLKKLKIADCQSLESFPDQNLPPNLEELYISNCKELKPLSECGLQSLSSLRRFTLHSVYPTLTSFPDSCFLPATLKFLRIDEFSNLKSLSKGLQNLASLEKLEISNCPELESLSEGLQNLTTIRFMDIINCPKIKSLSEGLRDLTSLEHLTICDCLSLSLSLRSSRS
ncbi:unnamed protein product [Ilex paraguariensis]|uniref:Disease resistance RPP13-like protein 1 n=1 Tax=Ilex paraguariensis TaxID=185542 RepID=A0ABC8TST3_9AQUA